MALQPAVVSWAAGQKTVDNLQMSQLIITAAVAAAAAAARPRRLIVLFISAADRTCGAIKRVSPAAVRAAAAGRDSDRRK